MALATQADVQTRLQITFTNPNEPVVTDLIEAAQGHIERVYGGPVEAANYTELHTGTVFLRHRPVNSITSITEDGTGLVEGIDYAWYRSGEVVRVSGGHPIRWYGTVDAVEVTYNAGFVTVPSDIVDVCAWMAASAIRRGIAFGSDEGALGAGTSSEEVGDYAIEYFASISNPASLVLMTDEQREIIESWRGPVLA